MKNGQEKKKLLKLFEKGIVVVKPMKETEVTKKKVVKQVVPVKKEEVAPKKENQESVPFIIQK